MDNLLKIYKDECKKHFSQFGFKSYKNSFYRVTNDVKQTFELRRYKYGFRCTVDFGIVPLCYRITAKNDGVGYELGLLDGSNRMWEYNPDDEVSVVQCACNLASFTSSWLIPFFEKGQTSSEAYSVICQLEKNIFGSIHLNDYVKYCLALKMGRYDTALLHLKSIEAQWEKSYNDRRAYGYLTEEYAQRKKNEFEELRREIRYLSKQDAHYIDRFIDANEAHSLKILS